jgi:cytochrome b pre-mRNA-processing protein 3
VTDSFDGRFDLVALHTWLVLDALAAAKRGDLQRRLFRDLFVAFDESLRDQGAGDMGIGRRVKAMTSALMGRINVYQGAADHEALCQALKRNLYRDAAGKDDCATAIAHYISQARIALAGCDLTQGADFGSLPRMMETSR